VKAALQAAVERFGRVDITCDIAGIEHPIKPVAEIVDDAAGVLWLCSDEAAFTMGHPMVVDTGQTA
jgi:hypothetical protein